MAEEWVNWSGSLRFTPAGYAMPSDEEALVGLVNRARESGTKLRPVGSGHSSSPLVRTDGVLVCMDHFAGTEPDGSPGHVTVGAGTTLHDLGEDLYSAGLAMTNLGDVNYQTLAGATATGTHGSGLAFGNLSTQVAGVRLVTGTGEVLEVSPAQHTDMLPAVQLSLGALGIVTHVTQALRPRFDIERVSWCAPIGWTLDHLDELQATSRNMDFYWYPRSDLAQIRTLNHPGETPGLRPPGPLWERDTGPSHRTITKHRTLKFDEIEYLLPSTAFPACFAEVRRRIKQRHRVDVAWRVLVRTVAADDIFLSGAHGHPTTTIACLQNSGLPHEEYFGEMEKIFRDHGGRPHWGKKHSLTAAELRPLYPRWDAFREVRRRLDPDGVFLTPDLARLLEEA
jgi:FAD/FMN-containing dehydrogenase